MRKGIATQYLYIPFLIQQSLELETRASTEVKITHWTLRKTKFTD